MNDQWPSYLGKGNRKQKQKSFGDPPRGLVAGFFALWFLWLVIWLSLVIGGIYVAVHFITKYW